MFLQVLILNLQNAGGTRSGGYPVERGPGGDRLEGLHVAAQEDDRLLSATHHGSHLSHQSVPHHRRQDSTNGR